MTIRQRLNASYNAFAKRPLRRPPYADELLWIPAWLVALPLARLGVAPEAIVVAGFLCGLGAVGLIAAGAGGAWAYLAAGLVLANAVLDSVDGGVARMTGRIRQIGGLMDLVLDFVFTVLIFGAIALRGAGTAGEQLALGLVCALALLANLLSATAVSWVMACDDRPEASASEVLAAFGRPPRPDATVGPRQRPLFRLLASLFTLGWGAVTDLLHRLGFLRRRPRPHGLARHLLALGAVGPHLAALALCLVLGWPLERFLAWEIGLGAMGLVLLWGLERG